MRNALSESVCHCWRPFPCFPFYYLVLFFFQLPNLSFHNFFSWLSSLFYLNFFLWAFKVRASLQSLHWHFKYKSPQGTCMGGQWTRRSWKSSQAADQGENELDSHSQTQMKIPRESGRVTCHPGSSQLPYFLYSSPSRSGLYFLSVPEDSWSLSNTLFFLSAVLSLLSLCTFLKYSLSKVYSWLMVLEK